jgi:hypothetical protein
MPFKSEAQRRKLYALSKAGKVKPEVVAEFEQATPKGKRLPERVTMKKAPRLPRAK